MAAAARSVAVSQLLCVLGRRDVGEQQEVGPDSAQTVQDLCERCHDHHVVRRRSASTQPQLLIASLSDSALLNNAAMPRCIAPTQTASPYSTVERRVPQLIPVLGSQPAGDVSHKPGGRLPLLSARPAVTPAILKRAATSFAAW